MNGDADIQRLQATFARVVSKYHSVRNRPMDYGTGELLHPAEMDAISTVGRSPGIHVTDLAGKLGVTKGAASQMAVRLAKKRLLQKSEDPTNSKRVRLHLTEKGETAFQFHKRFQDILDSHMRSTFQRLTPKQLQFIHEWLEKMEATTDRYREALGLRV